ncbi:glucocorticoid receptor-like (DNA-binding domain) [Wilcoxina mikolae CBS 423.85]|nr:glucocorticoid receptor-like (DNA-binding domain) [Wilcoxina mikolae CBS 423.85]
MFHTPSLLKPLSIGGFINARILKDHAKRIVFAGNEERRQALRFISRNAQLPQIQRLKAQLELNSMHCHTRPTQIKNRCIMAGKGKGVFRDFRMARFQFRLNALAGNIPGVSKASW